MSRSFDRDIKLMTLLVWFVRTFRLRRLEWVIDPLTEFAAWTRDELDRVARVMDQAIGEIERERNLA